MSAPPPPGTSLSRRSVLKGSLALAVGGAAVACSKAPEPQPAQPTGAALALSSLTPPQRAIYEHLHPLLPGLDSEQALADFARAHVAAGRSLRTQRPEPDGLVTSFLLSTDFFQTGANPKRKLRFSVLYSPLSACRNPFAQLG